MKSNWPEMRLHVWYPMMSDDITRYIMQNSTVLPDNTVMFWPCLIAMNEEVEATLFHSVQMLPDHNL